MNLHQVLTGAVNPGDNCFSVGSHQEQPITAYASGCDIVILGSDFERLQVIPGVQHGNVLVGCIDCSMQQGRVNLIWTFLGTRLLTGSSSLQLWSNVALDKLYDEDIQDKADVGSATWRCIWQCRTAFAIHLMKFSPDGEFFATAGKDDCLVKVWYNTESWHSAVNSPVTSPERQGQGEVDFSFVYLAHPRSVNGFSWRKTSKYMARGSVCNVLLTCCKDNVCRIWAETLLPNDSLLCGDGFSQRTAAESSNNHFKRNPSSKERVQSALELNLKPFRRGRRRSLALLAHTGYPPNQHDAHEIHRNTPLNGNALCHFHIAASINPATDIPLLPSISSMSLNEQEEKSGPFVVHWLNNKELHFSLSMEVFLQQLKKSCEQQTSELSAEDTNLTEVDSEEEAEDIQTDNQKPGSEKKEMNGVGPTLNSPFVPLPPSVIDHEIEILLSEWNKNPDMLFSIHPVDGSLLVWHVDWLDEYQPGMFRQVQVSFSCRIPVAFPTGDANSLCRSIVMYASTKNVDLAIQQGKQKPAGMARSTSMLISSGQSKSSSSLKLSIFTPNVLMISKHADGSLNQWQVSFAEESAFSTVLSISHKSRYCGHRFHLSDLACHSILPLLLTTSHHNSMQIPGENGESGEPDSLGLEACSQSVNAGDSMSEMCQDGNAVYSELILWRVDPVGPLSFSGGVSELARINSLHISAFSNVAWLPTIIPSHCLGTYCNSPSACFVASDGQNLRLYQAVIDAKKLLCELSNPDITKYVGEVFSIISQQSTARPGCIIELDAITNLRGRKTQLLHVFQEDFILGTITGTSGKTSQSGFSETFYLVAIECAREKRSVLHMWKLHLESVPVSAGRSEIAQPRDESFSSQSGEKVKSPLSQKYQTCKANLQSTSKLTLSSHLVYSQDLELPEGVEIISVKPSAGHLSSSSIYPVCHAPFLLATSCSDGKVRFWRCRVDSELPISPQDQEHSITYIWEEWPLLIEDGHQNGFVSVPGRPIEVSCAHTNCLAVAFKQTPSRASNASQDFSMHVSIFECESTGGSCWILEQTIHFDELSAMLEPGITVDNNLVAYNNPKESSSSSKPLQQTMKPLVRLDWMSREDGSHLLTIGIGSKLLMYGQVGRKVQEQSCKEDFALHLWDAAKSTSRPRFVLLRCVDLVSSVEGSPPIPVSLSWVRDGILVVGMDCEMHVYSQWQPFSKQDSTSTDSYNGSTPSITNLLKQSQSVGSGLYPPKKVMTRSMTSLAQKLMGKKTAFDLPVEMEDSGLFEAAHSVSPTLPQYHPLQLLELMDLGKVRRAKAILSHLVKCIAGEVVAINDNESNHERRLRSLSISVSGSTARDPKTFSKPDNADYTEIDSVPPLPLHALLAADEDTIYPSTMEQSSNANNSSKRIDGNTASENYEDLFQVPPLASDELSILDSEEESKKPQVIDLSQYGPTYFGPEHSQVLSRHLLHSSLPGLTRIEQMSLLALADTIATTSTEIGESRDRSQGIYSLFVCLFVCFFTSVKCFSMYSFKWCLSNSHFAWAFHSVAEEELLATLPAMQKADLTWPELRAMGVGWWVRNTHNLRTCIEKVAKAAFQRNNDPLDAAIFYLAMKKKAVIWGLYRSQRDKKMTQFFGNNFSEERWRKAALKNAFSLLGKQRFEHSAAFFLLAGSLKDAVEVCLEKLYDIQLALVLARLYEPEFEKSSSYKSILQKRVLGIESPGKEPTLSFMHSDPFVRSMAYWILGDYSQALNTLLKQPVQDEDESWSLSSSCEPSVFNFYNFLRTHPMLLRRHYGSTESSSTKMCVTGENVLADKINLGERRLFFTTAHAHLKAGCPMLSLEVLSKMPKVVKKSKSFPRTLSFVHTSKASSPVSLLHEEKDSNSMVNGFGSSLAFSDKESNSALSFDWSQPSLAVEEELELKWDSQDSDEESGVSGLSMKEVKPSQGLERLKREETSTSYSDSLTNDDNYILSPSEDVIAAQLKFRACLKILTGELRTLSTGYEVDGGKLRYQLYSWLERAVLALQKICDYNGSLDESSSVGTTEISCEDSLDDSSDQNTTKQAKELFHRRQWLLKFQSLLRMFLSFCVLHGSHGGGLASVRMELILLLQESQQTEQTSIPLLFACTASAKTVVASPLLHLSNLTHDILHAIIDLDSPPHPDAHNNKIYVMHTLAASLSACIYQCLCGGQANSASLQTNPFTGMEYQSVLLIQRQSLRTSSLDDAVTPNTSPTHWPGIGGLIHLLNSAGEEAQPGLTILLCEILTAVYLSLFIHGLATHSSQELFCIVAHPLSNKMWSAVFGGGVRIPGRGPMPVKAPYIPMAYNILEYDSEESQASDDEEDDDLLLSDIQIQEHSNANSYSWALMRLAMVQYVLQNLKTFYPLVGHELSELPVASPLSHAILKTLQRWEQVLLKRLEIFGGSPPDFITIPTSEEAASAGPAILRHKALLEPTNTPFRSKHSSALPVKRLWQYLVKQECIQETFIRNIFVKKSNLNETEADQSAGGGRVRVIHKDSDIITAFAVNKANRNCIAIASSHDIQELDVSSIIATQIYSWVDEESETENKGSDDFLMVHTREDVPAAQSSTPYTHSNPGTPLNMPWLGATQTGSGASVMIKKTINNVRRMASHPSLPYYLTGAQDGSVRMFEWGHTQQITCFRNAGNSRVTRIRFNHQGNKFGIVDADGLISLYQTNWKYSTVAGAQPKAYLSWQCHNKTANDFVFVSSSSLIATAGQSTDNRNICLWDTLVSPANSAIHAFTCHDSGATVISYAPKNQMLISGGRKGFICLFDLRQRQQRHMFQSHDSAVKAIAIDTTEEYFITGSAEGNIKVWSLSTFSLLHTFINEHARQSLFRNIGTGVMQIETGPANHIFSCGADGTVKMRILPDRFRTHNDLLKNDVKFVL
uniref:Dmx like 1 n=1 Tax=Leptobrachium leishanense TaxID=445787 RepID=A0A8C5MH23_9ANUR